MCVKKYFLAIKCPFNCHLDCQKKKKTRNKKLPVQQQHIKKIVQKITNRLQHTNSIRIKDENLKTLLHRSNSPWFKQKGRLQKQMGCPYEDICMPCVLRGWAFWQVCLQDCSHHVRRRLLTAGGVRMSNQQLNVGPHCTVLAVA